MYSSINLVVDVFPSLGFTMLKILVYILYFYINFIIIA
jgi:hypothetical protein